MDKVLLIDGYNALWRATHTMDFGKKKPEDDQAVVEDKPDYLIIFNFFRNLRPLIELFSPDKCFFVLEGRSEYRYNLYPEYKANRIIKYGAKKELMTRFNTQKAEIIRLLKLLPITTILAKAYEADDVIGTLCQDLKDDEITVLSNDSDFIQLLQKPELKNVRVYNPIKKAFMEAPTYHYVGWKSLAGDTSDNIEGLVGKKRAETLVSDPEKFTKFLALEEHRANFNRNKLLIELQNVPFDDLILEEGTANWNALKEEFNRMEFASITNDKSWAKYTSTFNCIKF